MKKPKGEYAIQAVINAIRLLETFRDEEEQGVTPLAKRLDLHKNNVFRLLATLEQLGYIEQCAASDRYRLGVRSLELGQSFGRSRNLLRRARPVIDELVETCGESAHLGLLRELEVVHVESRSPDRLVTTGTRVGRSLPAHCTALGKAMLAELPEEAADRLLRKHGMLRHNENTIASLRRLKQELAVIRQRGYAVDDEEEEIGFRCVGAAVHGSDGTLAAVSVSGTADQIDVDNLALLAERVKAAAGAVSARQPVSHAPAMAGQAAG